MKLLSKIEQKVNYLKELEEKVSYFCGCSCPLCGAKSHRCTNLVSYSSVSVLLKPALAEHSPVFGS